MTEILLTGGTGLVGSRMLTRLVAAGIACRGLVRAGKALPDGVEVHRGDILDPATLPAAVDGVDAVIHLAASFRNRDDDETWRVNLEGTQVLIAAVEAHAPQARFVMASTSNVYDVGQARPGRENDDVNPAFAYPASKVRAEQELRASALNWSVLRLPFVYGDGDGHLEASMPMLAQGGAHPAQRMSLAHHVDIAAAFALALTGVMDGRVVNIADEAPTSLYELARIAGHDYPESVDPLTNPWQGQADVSLARSLGFRPTVRTIHQATDEGLL